MTEDTLYKIAEGVLLLIVLNNLAIAALMLMQS